MGTTLFTATFQQHTLSIETIWIETKLAGLAVPCVFLVAFGAYISHFQSRCDGAVRIFCPCLPTIWEDGRQPPRPRELDAVVVISRIPEQRRTHFYPKKRLSESELACVVVMPDKTKQIAFPQDPVGSGRRIEAALLRPPILFHSTSTANIDLV